ncbi:MAG TPA: ABC transporter permease, partial [Patescibacteria group bacterium]|nr:ABC transporter permease [Patescibacteria group bacterium]
METFLQDLRYGFRMLMKSPSFTVVSVITLALGIGANTAIFSVVNTVLLRPLPYAQPDHLVTIWGQLTKFGIPRNSISQPEYVDLREQNEVFDAIAAYNIGSFNVSGEQKPEFAAGAYVSHELFDVLKVLPARGRGFTIDEEKPGAGHVVIVSDGFWRRRFGSDPAVLGRTVTLDGESNTIVGVMPAGFEFPSASTDLWTPMTIDLPNHDRGGHYLKVIARTRSGITLPQATASLTSIARNLERQYPDNYKDAGWNLYLVPLHEQIVGAVKPALLMLLVAVVFVLIIACTNVANLMLARAASREKEAAIRTALGAGRLRLIRQLLTESLVLAIVGGGLGLLLAFWGIDALLVFGPDNLPRLGQVAVDGRVLVFTLAASLIAGALFGIVPALQVSRPSLNETLKEGSGRASGGLRGRRARSVLVVAEVALSLVLLAGAGLMLRSFSRMLEVDPGFDPKNVLT